MCATVYGWRHLLKATEVIAGLAESNVVTCRLTACTLGSASGPTLGNELAYGRTLPFLNKKHLKNVGPIRHCEPPHAHSPGVASGTVARRLRIDLHDDNDNA